jgi:FlaA1/EpsC-like NDP-sugar epimerase
VLNMGEPIRILSLAEDLIRLSGLEPHRDIEIAFTGVRPGEKMTEELWEEGMPLLETPHPDIFRLNTKASPPIPSLLEAVDSLSASAHSGDTDAILELLDELIPGSSIRQAPQPDITFVI